MEDYYCIISAMSVFIYENISFPGITSVFMKKTTLELGLYCHPVGVVKTAATSDEILGPVFATAL